MLLQTDISRLESLARPIDIGPNEPIIIVFQSNWTDICLYLLYMIDFFYIGNN